MHAGSNSSSPQSSADGDWILNLTSPYAGPCPFWPSFLLICFLFWRQRARDRERAHSLLDQVSDLKDKVSELGQLLQGSKKEMREVSEERDRLLREASERRAAESESKKQQRNITFELEEVKLSCAKALQTAAGHEETCRYFC
jgi:hypothetical protein